MADTQGYSAPQDPISALISLIGGNKSTPANLGMQVGQSIAPQVGQAAQTVATTATNPSGAGLINDLLTNAHKEVTASVYKKAIKDQATQMQQAGVTPGQAMAHAHDADVATGLHQDPPQEGEGAAQPQGYQAPPATQDKNLSPMDILKGILPMLNLPQMAKNSMAIQGAQTPQGLLNLKEAEGRLPLTREQQVTANIGAYTAQIGAAKDDLTAAGVQQKNLIDQYTAIANSRGTMQKTFSTPKEMLKSFDDNMKNITDKQQAASDKIKELLGQHPNLQPSRSDNSGYKTTSLGIKYKVK